MKHNKLVRNKIPDIIMKQGGKPVTQILSAEAYKRELQKKLHEEVAEFDESGGVEELADILEVVFALAATGGFGKLQLEEMRKQKQQERGGFDQRIFLVETQSAKLDMT